MVVSLEASALRGCGVAKIFKDEQAGTVNSVSFHAGGTFFATSNDAGRLALYNAEPVFPAAGSSVLAAALALADRCYGRVVCTKRSASRHSSAETGRASVSRRSTASSTAAGC